MRKIPHWTEEYTEGESIDLLTDLAGYILETGSVPSQASWMPLAVRRREYRRICEFVLDYTSVTIAEARTVRQVQALFQKAEFLDVGIDRESVARQKYEDAETLCRETNALFRQWKAGTVGFRQPVERAFHMAQRAIARVLGDVPTVESLGLRFGPGATTRTKKRHASVKRKLSAEVSCSEELLPWAARLLAELPHIVELNWVKRTVEYHGPTGLKLDVWTSVDVLIEVGAVSFVVKNYGAFRPVETQPPLNGMFQLSIGDYMSDKCAVVGLDLSDQSRNREAARVGSLTGALATLDLSSASDTIATELVAHLLPLDWFSMLHAARVGKTKVPWSRTEIRLEKFSAMGNGYTFPLESLIFWALSQACVDLTCRETTKATALVYGDDIIIPTESVELLKEVLTAAGFLVNTKKSYWQGPFRESCGADMLHGIDIRPVYVKSLLTPAGLFALHNGLYRRGEMEAAQWVARHVHPALLIKGPDGYGDGHLLSENWQGRPYGRRKGFGGSIFDTFTKIPKRDLKGLQPGERILPQYTVYRRGESPLVPRLVGTSVLKLRGPRPKNGSKPLYVEVNEPTDPIPWKESEEPGLVTKATTLPGDEGYKRISIYTLQTPNWEEPSQ